MESRNLPESPGVDCHVWMKWRVARSLGFKGGSPYTESRDSKRELGWHANNMIYKGTIFVFNRKHGPSLHSNTTQPTFSSYCMQAMVSIHSPQSFRTEFMYAHWHTCPTILPKGINEEINVDIKRFVVASSLPTWLDHVAHHNSWLQPRPSSPTWLGI